ncbi:MAG: tRNA (uridine(34)/cytosine(34)/5-carboxymethylaminomethyluridine(34)-2'-O)-methyltransferase TrmL [Betaproteobacteria bacterium HGW-Betaproteobacteria-11]|nr:MAG: tRNA (uridine(34)/cytosine(34)/5-carboxymethylaminomethyluridine(34)-2'-O)-methyltransferase TrmL [Betaproteobacteria bacterium HGW-Betaproteobacteria-11]
MPFHVVLVAPEIPPNTGNAIRLCANTGAHLHLVEPLGFDLSARQLRRAGMDYAELAAVSVHADWTRCREALAAFGAGRRFALTTKGNRRHTSADFSSNDVFVFGNETSGLPPHVLADIAAENRLRLPLVPGNRSLNLSNTVAIVVYEAWRQLGFSGGE